MVFRILCADFLKQIILEQRQKNNGDVIFMFTFYSRKESKFMNLQGLLPRKIIIWSLLYCNIDARSIQFLFKLSIAPFTEAGFKQFIFIPSDLTVLLTYPEVATKVVLYKKSCP